MKELFIFLSVYIILVVFHRTEAIRAGNKWIKHQNRERRFVKERWTRNNLANKGKDSKRLKLNASHGKNDASQNKRQFVPEMPFLNFPHPHIHRIIVHHHPGRSNGYCIYKHISYFPLLA